MKKRYGHATSRNTAQGYVYIKNGHDKRTHCTHILSQTHKVKYSNKLYLKTSDIDGVRLLHGFRPFIIKLEEHKFRMKKYAKYMIP